MLPSRLLGAGLLLRRTPRVTYHILCPTEAAGKGWLMVKTTKTYKHTFRPAIYLSTHGAVLSEEAGKERYTSFKKVAWSDAENDYQTVAYPIKTTTDKWPL